MTNKLIPGYLFILFILACGVESTQSNVLNNEIKAYEENPGTTTAAELNRAIIAHLREYPELSSEAQNELLSKGYEVSQEQNMLPEAVNFVNSMLRNTSDPTAIDQLGQELINLLDKMNNKEAANTLKLSYKKAFPKSNANINFAVNSEMKYTNIDDKINRLASSMFDDSTHQFSNDIATKFIDACEAHALLLPDEEASIDYLHKAGETARSIRSFRKAVSIYDWLYSKYPNDGRASQALFLKAFTFDNDLKDLEMARQLYEEYLEKYPNEDFADDTRFLLENLGKSDEEILQELNKQDSE